MNNWPFNFLQSNTATAVVVVAIIAVFISLFAEFSDGIPECKKLHNESEKYFCYATAAVAQRDAGVCKQLRGEQVESCRLHYAVQLRDLAACELMARNVGAEFCTVNVALAKRDDEVCKQVRLVSYRDACYGKIAVQLGNVSICDFIANASVKAECGEDARAASTVQEAQRTR